MGECSIYVSLKIMTIKRALGAAGTSHSIMQNSNYPFTKELCRWWQEHSLGPTESVVESVQLSPGVGQAIAWLFSAQHRAVGERLHGTDQRVAQDSS